MYEWVYGALSPWHPGFAAILATLLAIVTILAAAVVLYFLLTRVGARVVAVIAGRKELAWREPLARHRVLTRLLALGPPLLVRALAVVWLPAGSVVLHVMLLAAHLWMLLTGLIALYALIDALVDIYNGLAFARQMPMRGFAQGVKLLALLAFLVVVIALLAGTSPGLLISGLGAMTAVMMLIFKDPILGFVAGIQLSANRMLAVGDWLEMPKYQADGDVIEVTLTTVKVRNWDQTITTVPTYALIADSFKNWRGMQEIGGRRIMRSLYIDMHSVRFLSSEDIERLRKAQLIAQYIETKLSEIADYNRENKVDPCSPVNGRHLTNIGTLRAYIMAYLKAHPGIHPGLIMMVRQLQPTAEGLPIQIYAFTRDTAWVAHENVQSDIFDHLLAVVSEFGLRVYQMPSGSDVRGLLRPAAVAER